MGDSKGEESSCNGIEASLQKVQLENGCHPPKLHCFSSEASDTLLHFQILQLSQQLFIWIGCNSAKFGNLYASLPTPFDDTPSLAVLIGGGADSVGAGIARRLAQRTGWSIILACDLPRSSPMLELQAERRLLQELKSLGCIEASVAVGESSNLVSSVASS